MIALALLLAKITDPVLLQQLNEQGAQAHPWDKAPVVKAAPNPFDRFSAPPTVNPKGPFELVVRFPGNAMGYNHTYSTAAACGRARAVILADYRARSQASEQAAKERGATAFFPGAPPVAVCVPL